MTQPNSRYLLNCAGAKFTQDARDEVRSCSELPQALNNAADSVKLVLLKGEQS